MIAGRVSAPVARALSLASVLCLASALPLARPAASAPASPPKPPAVRAAAPAAPHSKSVHPATLVSVDDAAVHVTLDDGEAMDAEIRPSSLFLIAGMDASPGDFKPGTRVFLRTRTRASDGVLSVVMLSDPATLAAIDAYRRRPLVGHVVSVAEKTLVVQPGGPDATPVMLHVTPKTVFRHGGVDATLAAFPVGVGVTVITRGLPSGLLMAEIVSDKVADAEAQKAVLKPVSLVGTAVEVQDDKGLLTLAPRTKPRQTVAVTEATKIKVARVEAMLRQITPGMRVSARLGHRGGSSVQSPPRGLGPAATVDRRLTRSPRRAQGRTRTAGPSPEPPTGPAAPAAARASASDTPPPRAPSGPRPPRCLGPSRPPRDAAGERNAAPGPAAPAPRPGPAEPPGGPARLAHSPPSSHPRPCR